MEYSIGKILIFTSFMALIISFLCVLVSDYFIMKCFEEAEKELASFKERIHYHLVDIYERIEDLERSLRK